ncbi:MAG: hypothetical protein ACFCVE_14070 [Phycisphaerae bacterium]
MAQDVQQVNVRRAGRGTYPVPDPIRPAFSLPSILAIVCAVLAFFSTGFGLLFAVLAIVFGLLGALLAISPLYRGGLISIFSIGAGVIGAIVAVIRLIFWIVT